MGNRNAKKAKTPIAKPINTPGTGPVKAAVGAVICPPGCVAIAAPQPVVCPPGCTPVNAPFSAPFCPPGTVPNPYFRQ